MKRRKFFGLLPGLPVLSLVANDSTKSEYLKIWQYEQENLGWKRIKWSDIKKDMIIKVEEDNNYYITLGDMLLNNKVPMVKVDTTAMIK